MRDDWGSDVASPATRARVTAERLREREQVPSCAAAPPPPHSSAGARLGQLFRGAGFSACFSLCSSRTMVEKKIGEKERRIIRWSGQDFGIFEDGLVRMSRMMMIKIGG